MTIKIPLHQALTSLTATGLITFTVTHMHQDVFHFEPRLWGIHWITAWPIAFCTIRYIAPLYSKMLHRILP